MSEVVMIHKGFLSSTALAVLLAVASVQAFGAPPVEPKGYSIAEINVTHAEAYKQYVAAVSPIVAHFEGKYLVRAGAIVPLEGEAPTGRFIVIEFPSLSIAKAFESSPEYRAIVELRHRASRSRVFLVEGSPQP